MGSTHNSIMTIIVVQHTERTLMASPSLPKLNALSPGRALRPLTSSWSMLLLGQAKRKNDVKRVRYHQDRDEVTQLDCCIAHTDDGLERIVTAKDNEAWIGPGLAPCMTDRRGFDSDSIPSTSSAATTSNVLCSGVSSLRLMRKKKLDQGRA